MLDIETRSDWGINNTGPASGVFDPTYPGSSGNDGPVDMPNERHVIRSAMVDGREVAVFSNSIHVPLAPFMGIMAVAPEGPVIGQPGVDFRVAEAVDLTQVVTGHIPKSLFLD